MGELHQQLDAMKKTEAQLSTSQQLAAAATAGVTGCDMYWEGFTLFMLKAISSDNFSFQSYQNKNLQYIMK